MAKATRSHLTRTARPLLRHALHFSLGGKLAAIGFGERLVNFFDLPTVQGEVVPDSFRSQEGAGAAGGLGELVQLAGEVVVQAEGENFLRGHGWLLSTIDYIVFGLEQVGKAGGEIEIKNNAVRHVAVAGP